MKLNEIKTAVDSGITVNWSNSSYVVIRHFPRYPDTPEYLIKCITNDHCIGLTWRNGKTLNGKESVLQHKQNVVFEALTAIPRRFLD